MNIDNLMSLMFGVLIGANFGVVLAGLFSRRDDD
jgi:hypothetical protein